jgi:hypothetical protein
MNEFRSVARNTFRRGRKVAWCKIIRRLFLIGVLTPCFAFAGAGGESGGGDDGGPEKCPGVEIGPLMHDAQLALSTAKERVARWQSTLPRGASLDLSVMIKNSLDRMSVLLIDIDLSSPLWQQSDTNARAGILILEALRQIQAQFGLPRLSDERLQSLTSTIVNVEPNSDQAVQ